MALIWFVVWLIANVVGGSEPLMLDPVNPWMGTPMLVVALDLSSQHAPQLGRTHRAEWAGLVRTPMT